MDPYARLAGVYDEIVVDPCHARWAAFLDRLWGADAEGVRTVLDVCCGTGLMTAELAALGYRVTGVDASPAMLARARALLGPEVSLVHATLPDAGVAGPFDAAVSTFDGLNYLTPDAFRRSLTAIAARLRPGGWFAFDLHTDAMMALAAGGGVLQGEARGHRWRVTNTVDLRARTCASRVEVTRTADGARFGETHHQHFFGEAEIRAALVGAGFGAVAVTDEYSHRPVDATTLRATWIARREAAARGR